MDLRQRFGKLVAANRRRAGLTQQQLADSAGLSPDMIARIEMGRTGARFPSIERIAVALDVDPAELFSPMVAGEAPQRKVLLDLTARLAKLSDKDLDWAENLLEAALRSRG